MVPGIGRTPEAARWSLGGSTPLCCPRSRRRGVPRVDPEEVVHVDVPRVSVWGPPFEMSGITFVRPPVPVPPAVPPPVQLNQVSSVKSTAPRPGAPCPPRPERDVLARAVELKGRSYAGAGAAAAGATRRRGAEPPGGRSRRETPTTFGVRAAYPSSFVSFAPGARNDLRRAQERLTVIRCPQGLPHIRSYGLGGMGEALGRSGPDAFRPVGPGEEAAFSRGRRRRRAHELGHRRVAICADAFCLNTCPTVIHRILRSRPRLQLSTYQTSISSLSSHARALRPLTCAQPVSPGRTSWRRA